MKLNLISLSTVKTQLGISDGTYDSEITAMIPIVSSDVRRILGTNYDCYMSAYITISEATINLSTYNLEPALPMGQVIYNPNIPDDTYLQSYDPDTGEYTMSSTATDTDYYIYPTVLVTQWPAISKMIWYRIDKQSTSSVSDETLKAYSVGPISKTYADSEINKQYNYPEILIRDLGIPFALVGK
ncbi:hypothetical protein [Pseudoalteromonas sp.]|uniref:hypothetical protein n=1 Tax=Pseudoalteromonas sp. TaxID=53249 RepID=UPI002635FEAC|nr:hypothetical protein [Pseudoalteromonas sp.]MCP4585643.1 hypothetical protein [Pseudoalteromonas sp.]